MSISDYIIGLAIGVVVALILVIVMHYTVFKNAKMTGAILFLLSAFLLSPPPQGAWIEIRKLRLCALIVIVAPSTGGVD